MASFDTGVEQVIIGGAALTDTATKLAPTFVELPEGISTIVSTAGGDWVTRPVSGNWQARAMPSPKRLTLSPMPC